MSDTASQPGTEGAAPALHESVARNTMLMTAGTLVSRATGLLRTWMMAFAMGSTMYASAYQIANNLPNVIYELVAGGLISAAFLPVLMSERERAGDEGADEYASNVINLVLVVMGAISVLAILFSEVFVRTQTFTVGADSEVSAAATQLFRIFAVQIVLYSIGGVFTGLLNSNRSFFLTAVAPALNNICVIAGFAAYMALSPSNPQAALALLAVLTTGGVAVQFGVQIPAVRKTGFKWRPVLNPRSAAMRETVGIAAPTVVFVIASVAAVSARNAFALGADDSGPAILAYAWLWFQLPYGVVAVSLSQTMFTEMSDAAAKADRKALAMYTAQGLRGTLLLILPLSAALFAMAPALAGLFRAGAFSVDDIASTALALRIWACALPAYASFFYLYKAFAAARRMGAFAALNVCAVAVQIGLYAWLTMGAGLGLAAIPAADCAYYGAGAVAACLLLRKFVGELDLRSVAPDIVKSAVSSVVAGAIATGVLALLPPVEDMLMACAAIAAGGVAWLLVVLAAYWVSGLSELSDILRRFSRRHGELPRD